MRSNRSNSGQISTETKWNGKTTRAHGLRKPHKKAHGPALQTEERPCAEHNTGLRNYIWSCHLIKALPVQGRIIRIFTVINEHTQECLLGLADHYISNQDVIDELFSLFLQRGIPKYLVTFGADDLLPKALCEWIDELELSGTIVEMKKYGENGHGALFIKRFTRDLFEEKRFASVADAKMWLSNWQNAYNSSIHFRRI